MTLVLHLFGIFSRYRRVLWSLFQISAASANDSNFANGPPAISSMFHGIVIFFRCRDARAKRVAWAPLVVGVGGWVLDAACGGAVRLWSAQTPP